MLAKETIQTVNNFVAQKPRTIQEIAELLGRNWRTAENYVSKIAAEQGTLAVRTFRKGTKGALKIVYWNILRNNQSTFQEAIFQKILHAKQKKDFSPFDIYQYIDEAKRECFLEEQEGALTIKQDLISTVTSARQQLLIFSGDLSWARATQEKMPLISVFETLIARGVPIKILAHVDLNSQQNVNAVLALNHQYGKELIEVRHCTQPLRSFIVDQNLLRIKEQYFLKEKAGEHYLFYSITDTDWIQWMQKVFWHFFSTSISAQKRLKDLETIRKM